MNINLIAPLCVLNNGEVLTLKTLQSPFHYRIDTIEFQ